MEEMSILIDNRFGYGTWRQIVNERAKRLQEEKQRIKEQKAAARRRREEFQEAAKIVGWVVGGILTFVVVGMILAISLRG